MPSPKFQRRTILATLLAVTGWSGIRWIESYIRNRVFPADVTPMKGMSLNGTTFTVIELAHEDGSKLSGLLAKSLKAKASVVYLHGNGGNAEKAAVESAMLVARGYDVYVADYRGYGGNSGVPSERGLIDDAALFVNYALGQASSKPVILVGHSMGGALAVMLATSLPIAGLLTWGAVARLSDLIPAIGRLFFYDRFNALEAASRINVPWLIIHGDLDDVVPLADAHRLKQVAKADIADLIVLGGDHVVDPEALAKFVEQLFARVR